MVNQTKHSSAKAFKTISFIILFLFPNFFQAQCAMCKAVVENGDNSMAQGINYGIIYLMAFPYLILALGVFFYVKKRKKRKAD